nr:replication protein A 70 kDa DNA-binding subunit D-like [Ipomoea batatas]
MIPFYNADLKEPLIVVLQLCRAKIVNGKYSLLCYLHSAIPPELESLIGM